MADVKRFAGSQPTAGRRSAVANENRARGDVHLAMDAQDADVAEDNLGSACLGADSQYTVLQREEETPAVVAVNNQPLSGHVQPPHNANAGGEPAQHAGGRVSARHAWRISVSFGRCLQSVKGI